MKSNSDLLYELLDSLPLEQRREAQAIIIAYCANDIPREILEQAIELAKRSVVPELGHNVGMTHDVEIRSQSIPGSTIGWGTFTPKRKA